MPKDIPEELKPLAMTLKAAIETLPKLPNGFPDLSKIPADVKPKLQEFKAAYEKATGNTLPMLN